MVPCSDVVTTAFAFITKLSSDTTDYTDTNTFSSNTSGKVSPSADYARTSR